MKLSLTQMPELKEAILSLPEKEKDKLLTRLINKDQMLIKQLHYKLLENEEDLLDRTKEKRLEIIESFKPVTKHISRINSYRKYDVLNLHIRSLNGVVNEHASITKDKVSELELRLLILQISFEHFNDLYQHDYHNKYAAKHFEYIASKVKAILLIYSKLHPDLQFDYRENLLTVLEYVSLSGVLSFIKHKDIDLETYFN